MSIDKLYYCPKPAESSAWTKYLPGEMPKQQYTRHQVFLAHQQLTDEQYFFENEDDARWFWVEGYKGRLILDDDGEMPMSYDRVSLWIDGEEVASRVDKALDGNSAKVEIGAHVAETQGAMAPGTEGRNPANLAKASAVVGDDETDPQIDDVAYLV